MIRILDILLSSIGLILTLPLMLIITVLILVDSRGGIFFCQIRVGKNGKDFRLIKFRTMATGAEQKGGLTVGTRDSRITRIGCFLRKYKLDEIPQLINVLISDMSMVGPRPEIRKYVEMYSDEQKKVLSVRPGMTDYASIEYMNENEILGRSTDPERTYIEDIMPSKIKLNMKFIDNPTIGNYFSIIWKTAISIFISRLYSSFS
ncbi:MAG: sugar transferase [Bacteroidales bacterium]|nr:sugar transferase [Bacteroidota bacterium]MBL6949622.1 sugar transferase [Bacteroidales bacterium]